MIGDAVSLPIRDHGRKLKIGRTEANGTCKRVNRPSKTVTGPNDPYEMNSPNNRTVVVDRYRNRNRLQHNKTSRSKIADAGLWRNRSRFRPSKPFRNRIAVRSSINRHRSINRRGNREMDGSIMAKPNASMIAVNSRTTGARARTQTTEASAINEIITDVISKLTAASKSNYNSSV